VKSFRRILALTIVLGAFGLDGVSARDRSLLLLAAILIAWLADIAHSIETRFEKVLRRAESRRDIRLHVEQLAEHAKTQVILAEISRQFSESEQSARAQVHTPNKYSTETGESATDAERVAALERSLARMRTTFDQVVALHDHVATYHALATDTIKDVEQALSGNAAMPNRVLALMGHPLVEDVEHEAKMPPADKLEAIRRRLREYHRVRTEKISNDPALNPPAPS
jgi:hypothetical protein